MTTTIVTTVTVRELKDYASSYLSRLQEAPNLVIIVTRHGKPCAKLVALSG